MFEHDGATGVNTTVTDSSMFGFNLSDDEVFSGQFTYDTSATESSFRANYPENNAAIYSSGLVAYDVDIGSFSYSSSSSGNVQIWDDRSGKDSFSISKHEFLDSDTFISSGFYMFDYTNSSQTGFLIPANLAQIYENGIESFTFAWLDRNNGDQLHFRGNITSLNAVPTPDSMWLIAAGLIGLISFSRKNKSEAVSE